MDIIKKLNQSVKILHSFVLHFPGLSNPQSTTIYDEIPEYEELKQNKEEKTYVNNDVVDKSYVSLKPVVMETVRNHLQSTVSVLYQSNKMSKSMVTYA